MAELEVTCNHEYFIETINGQPINNYSQCSKCGDIKLLENEWQGIKEELTKEEMKIIYQFLEHMHIPYDNYELLLAVKKLARIVNDIP